MSTFYLVRVDSIITASTSLGRALEVATFHSTDALSWAEVEAPSDAAAVALGASTPSVWLPLDPVEYQRCAACGEAGRPFIEGLHRVGRRAGRASVAAPARVRCECGSSMPLTALHADLRADFL